MTSVGHVHDWQDVTSIADWRVRSHELCTSCGAQRRTDHELLGDLSVDQLLEGLAAGIGELSAGGEPSGMLRVRLPDGHLVAEGYVVARAMQELAEELRRSRLKT